MWYITKYALSSGIIEARDDQVEVRGKYLYLGRVDLYLGRVGFMATPFCPGEFYPTLEEAVAKVRNLAEAKLRSLEKQRVHLEKLMNGEVKVIKREGSNNE